MGEKGGKDAAKRYSGVGGVAEAGGVIPWLIIKIVQGVTSVVSPKWLYRNSSSQVTLTAKG